MKRLLLATLCLAFLAAGPTRQELQQQSDRTAAAIQNAAAEQAKLRQLIDALPADSEPDPPPPPPPDVPPPDHPDEHAHTHGVPLAEFRANADFVVASGQSRDLIGEAGIVYVETGGTLRIQDGASAVTIAGDYGSTIDLLGDLTILDRPFEDWDLLQWGHGLVTFGRAHWAGEETTPWLRCAGGLTKGTREITLSAAPVNWKPGDVLAIPDSHSLTTKERFDPSSGGINLERQKALRLDEESVIASVNGPVVTLVSPLKHDHPAAFDRHGNLVGRPAVGNLSRSLSIRSENPNGVRGHVAFIDRADVDVSHVEFVGLGRSGTLALDIDLTRIESSDGQTGRYPVHFHHVTGPPNPTNTGHQFRCVGNSNHGYKRWAYTVHQSHFGLIERNVAWDGQEIGFMCEDGMERWNDFLDNFSARTRFGFWLSAGSRVENNVAAACWDTPIVLGPMGSKTVQTNPARFPTKRGQMHSEYAAADRRLHSTVSEIDNEIYSCGNQPKWTLDLGANITLKDAEQNHFDGLLIWNNYQGLQIYATESLTGRRLRCYNTGQGISWSGGVTVYCELEDVIVNGGGEGIHVRPRGDATRFVIRGGEIQATQRCIRHEFIGRQRAVDPDVTCELDVELIGPVKVVAQQTIDVGSAARPYRLQVGDQRIYFQKQAAAYVHIAERGVPAAWVGKSNRELLETLGVCFAGEIATCETVVPGYENVFVCPEE